MVTSTDSGLAVPDWPLSYGQVMPPMVGGIFYEHGHRMVATTVGFLTIILAVWLWRKEQRRWLRNLGWIALALVITQGILGGITVLFLLPTPISVAHAATAQLFFCLTIVIAIATSSYWTRGRRGSHVPDRVRSLTLISGLLVFLQLIAGAVMRHTQSGLAIPDFPLSYGSWLPPFSDLVVPAVNNMRLADDLPPVTLSQIWIHFIHRIGAIVVSVAIVMTTRAILRFASEHRVLRDTAVGVFVLLCFQVLLGMLTVWTGKNIQVTTAHVATGALLLGGMAMLIMLTYPPVRNGVSQRDHVSSHVEGVPA